MRLSPITEDKAMAKSDTPERDTRVGIGPIKLADYLDQSKLVTRTGDNRLVKAEFDLWAGAFKDNLTNVLAENIGLLLPTERIFIYPWRLSEPMDYQIILDVVRFDGDLGKDAWLVARWSILGGKDKELVAVEPLQHPRAGDRHGLRRFGYGPEPRAGQTQPRDSRGDSCGGSGATREIICRTGMLLMITDLAAGPETRSDRDFVIVISEFVQT